MQSFGYGAANFSTKVGSNVLFLDLIVRTVVDIAILCRTNEGAATVADALQERGLPVTLGAEGLLSTPEARLTIACLRRMAGPDDTLAVAEIIALEAEHPPEQWLENRLRFLAAHPEDKSIIRPKVWNGRSSSVTTWITNTEPICGIRP